MTTPEVLDHLRRRGLAVVPTKRGAVLTCPAHDDHRPSLDLTTGRAGRTLLYCRRGCRVEDVVTAAGLRLGDLFAEPRSSPAASRPGSPLAALRAEAEALGHRQGWARFGVERYEAADAIRRADRVRRAARPEDDDATWELLAAAAHLTTTAEAVLAEGEA